MTVTKMEMGTDGMGFTEYKNRIEIWKIEINS